MTNAQSDPPLSPGEPTPQGTPPSTSDKNVAVLVWIGGIFFGFIPSLIVWLMNKDKPGWLSDQLREALNFQLTVLMAYLASIILCLVVVGFFLLLIVGILFLIFSIIGAVKVGNGEPYRCPLAIRLLK